MPEDYEERYLLLPIEECVIHPLARIRFDYPVSGLVESIAAVGQVQPGKALQASAKGSGRGKNRGLHRPPAAHRLREGGTQALQGPGCQRHRRGQDPEGDPHGEHEEGQPERPRGAQPARELLEGRILAERPREGHGTLSEVCERKGERRGPASGKGAHRDLLQGREGVRVSRSPTGTWRR